VGSGSWISTAINSCSHLSQTERTIDALRAQ
jgi:hypothetical protein